MPPDPHLPCAGSYFVIGFYRLQHHQELEAEQIVGSEGLQLQQLAQGHQLGAVQVLQG